MRQTAPVFFFPFYCVRPHRAGDRFHCFRCTWNSRALNGRCSEGDSHTSQHVCHLNSGSGVTAMCFAFPITCCFANFRFQFKRWNEVSSAFPSVWSIFFSRFEEAKQIIERNVRLNTRRRESYLWRSSKISLYNLSIFFLDEFRIAPNNHNYKCDKNNQKLIQMGTENEPWKPD